MFRGMRRFKQMVPEETTAEILERGHSGVLALLGDEDYPYAVPMSYAYADGKLYFHSAKTGHKIDAIRKYEKASFCVVDKDQIVPEEYTTYFRSVIAFGKIREMEDPDEIRRTITMLAEKYSPDHKEGIPQAVEKEFKILTMLEMEIDHLTGKEAIELVKERNK